MTIKGYMGNNSRRGSPGPGRERRTYQSVRLTRSSPPEAQQTRGAAGTPAGREPRSCRGGGCQPPAPPPRHPRDPNTARHTAIGPGCPAAAEPAPAPGQRCPAPGSEQQKGRGGQRRPGAEPCERRSQKIRPGIDTEMVWWKRLGSPRLAGGEAEPLRRKSCTIAGDGPGLPRHQQDL